jgi:hypothetical protein
MLKPLLQISNHHTASCGDPPIVDGDDPSLYIGYFENPFGEQWIFTYHRASTKCELRGGDLGWNSRFEVKNGTVPGVILGQAEAQWLAACWQAATGN